MTFIFTFLSFTLLSGMGSVPADSVMSVQVESSPEAISSDLLSHGGDLNLPPPHFFK
ncbi:MAG: hypothetical protein OXF06_05985 [Bacteroidetes bacterium]|nr:hypothetical protein [Bacteroidota bacterium]